MNNKYYKSIVQNLIDLKVKGYFSHIDIQNGFVDAKLDILLKSFAFIAEDIDNIIEKSKLHIKLNLMDLHYPFLFRNIVSKMIIFPTVNFDTNYFLVKKNYEFQAYEGGQIFYYRNSIDTYLIPIKYIESKTEYSERLDIKGDIGDYFIYINMKLLNGFHFIQCVKHNIRIMFASANDQDLNVLLMNLYTNAKIYMKKNGDLKHVGNLKPLKVYNLEDKNDTPQYIQALINYFVFPQIYHMFDIEMTCDDNDIFNTDNVEIFIPIRKYIKLKDFVFVNFLILTNLKQMQSSMISFQDTLKKNIYIDYLNRDILKIYRIHNVYTFNGSTSKQNSIQNFLNYSYDNVQPILENVYWTHQKEYINKQFNDYLSIDMPKLDIDQIETIVKEHVFFYVADIYQTINRKLNIKNVICITENKVLYKEIFYGPTFYRNVKCDNMQVLDNLFVIYNPDIIHSHEKRGIILNILNSLSYILGSNQYYDKVINKIELEHEFLESVVQNQYTSNIVLYKIKIFIGDTDAVNFTFYVALTRFIMYIFGMTIETHVVYYNVETNKIIYDEYSK